MRIRTTCGIWAIAIAAFTLADSAQANTPPTVANDTYSVVFEHDLIVPAPGVLTNDSDPEGALLHAAVAQQPSHGTLLVEPDGSFSYTPEVGYLGPDTFTYTASDGANTSSPATVTITVTDFPNTPPIAGDDQFTVREGRSLFSAGAILVNDIDPSPWGGSHLATVAKLETTTSRGTLTLNSSGFFTYTPNPNTTGLDFFTYRAGDGELFSEPATVTISVVPDVPLQVSAGEEHTCALWQDGFVTCWGKGSRGQLGNGAAQDSGEPVRVSGLNNAVEISAGGFHTCARTATGAVYCWGAGTEGQLGNGLGTDASAPVLIQNLTALGLSSGWKHTCAVKGGALGSTALCWGYGGEGQLGNGNKLNRLSPTAVSGAMLGVNSVSAGKSHTCAVFGANKQVRCWGQGNNGELGNGLSTTSTAPVDVVGLSAIASVSAGLSHTCALKQDGTATCWGRGKDGELGNGVLQNALAPVDVSGLTGLLSVSSGALFSCALKDDASVVCWGYGLLGQLGTNSTDSEPLPVPVSGMTDAVALDVGRNHSCAVRAGGQIACWGLGWNGQLGNQSTSHQKEPVQIAGLEGVVHVAAGLSHACALTEGGEVHCWGSGHLGQLGAGTFENSATPVQVAGLDDVISIAVGVNHACALKHVAAGPNEVVCWGEGTNGRLGNGLATNQPSPVAVPGAAGATAIAAGNTHTCAIVGSANVAMCWGGGSLGQLGRGSIADSLVPVAVGAAPQQFDQITAITAGAEHTCAVRKTVNAPEELWCWGRNFYGQLGDGGTQDRNLPVLVPATAQGAQAPIASLDGGAHHTCAVFQGQTAACWGLNSGGVLGDGTEVDRHLPVSVVDAGQVVRISAGTSHSCATRLNLAPVCWGNNEFGQLGTGTFDNMSVATPVSGALIATQISAGDAFTCAVDQQKKVWCWGNGLHGQLANGGFGYGSAPMNGVAPTAGDDAFSTIMNTQLEVQAPGVLINDFDAEGDTLQAQFKTGPAHGTVALTADGGFLYQPANDFLGFDTFTYTTTDGTSESPEATVTIEVEDCTSHGGDADADGLCDNFDNDDDNDGLTEPDNDPCPLDQENTCIGNAAPIAASDVYTLVANEATTVPANGVLANDTDADGDTLSAVLEDDVPDGGLEFHSDGGFTYTPTGAATATFSYKAHDGVTESFPVTVTLVLVANCDANGGDFDLDGICDDADNDDDNDGLTEPDNDPCPNDPANVCVAGNVAPAAIAGAYTLVANEATTVPVANGVLVNDIDSDVDPLIAVLASDPVVGALVLNSDGSFTYTAGAAGTVTFSYRANDGQVSSDPATVTLTLVADCTAHGDDFDGDDICDDTDNDNDGLIDDVDDPCLLDAANTCVVGNAAPLALADTYTVATNATTTVPAATGVLANDTDADGDALTALLETDVATGTLVLNADGSFTYTAGAAGAVTFSYRAMDSNGALSTPTTVILEVNCTANGGDFDGDGVCDDTDDDGDGLTEPGNDPCPLDPQNACMNAAPVAVADAYTLIANQTTFMGAGSGLLMNDTDSNGDPLTAVLESGPAVGTLVLNPNGSFVYTAGATGTVTFSYRASDGQALSAPATVTLTLMANCNGQGGDFDNDGICDNSDDDDDDDGLLDDVDDPCLLNKPNTCLNGNIAPEALADTYTVIANQMTTVAAANGVLANDTDVNGTPMIAVLVSAPDVGNLVLNADGGFTYTAGAAGTTETFTYRARDGSLALSPTVTVTLNVVAGCPNFDGDLLCDDADEDDDNDGLPDVTDPCPMDAQNVCNVAPVAVADTFTLVAGQTVTVPASGVLANDTDNNVGDTLSAVLESNPAAGDLEFNADGSFTYTAGAPALVTFTYRANDSQLLSAPATVMLNVVAACAGDFDNDSICDETDDDDDNDGLIDDVNDPCLLDPLNVCVVGNVVPAAIADTYTLVANAAATIAPETGVLINDTDSNGDALTAVLENDVTVGALAFNADGGFTYTAGAAGTVTFSYRASDGQALSAPATVTLMLVANCDANGGDFDLDGICDDTDADDDLIDDVDDPCLLDAENLCVADNTAPVAIAEIYTLVANATTTVPVTSGVLANDTDADGDALTAVLVNDVPAGDLTFNTDGSFSYVAGAVDALTFSYRAVDSHDALSAPATVTLMLVIDCTAHGDDFDNDGICDETDNDDDDDLIDDVNDPCLLDQANTCVVGNAAPVALADAYLLMANEATMVQAAGGVLANDTDADGDTMTAVLESGPAAGDLALNTNGSFTYTAGAAGTVTFSYRAVDSNGALSVPATVTLNVCASNFDGDGICDDIDNDDDGLIDDVDDPCLLDQQNTCVVGNAAPVAVADAYTLTANETTTAPAVIGVLGNDTDADGDVLTAVLESDVATGDLTLNTDGSFTYVAGAASTVTFTYRAMDSNNALSTPATVTLTVTQVNCDANGGNFDLDELCDDVDTDDDNDGLIDDVDDPCLLDPLNVCVVGNAAPLALADAYTLVANAATTVPAASGVLGNDTDADGDALAAVLESDVAAGDLTLNADGSFTYTAGAAGTVTFSYRADDGQALSAPATVTLTLVANCDANGGDFDIDGVCDDTDNDDDNDGLIDDVNDPCLLDPLNVCVVGNVPPAAIADAYTLVANQTTTVSVVDGVLANDTDSDGDQLSAVLESDVAVGDLVFNTDGSFTYTAGVADTVTFSYRANDGQVLSTPATVTLTLVVNCDANGGDFDQDDICDDTDNDDDNDDLIDDVNDPCLLDQANTCVVGNAAPVAIADAYTVVANETSTVSAVSGVLANDTDADGDALTAVLESDVATGTLVLNANGSFTYTAGASSPVTFLLGEQ